MTMMKGVKLVNFSFLDTYVPLFLRHPLNRAIVPRRVKGSVWKCEGNLSLSKIKSLLFHKFPVRCENIHRSSPCEWDDCVCRSDIGPLFPVSDDQVFAQCSTVQYSTLMSQSENEYFCIVNCSYQIPPGSC